MFADLPYANVSQDMHASGWPKLGNNPTSIVLFNELQRWPTIRSVMSKTANPHRLVVPKTAGYYIAAYESPEERTKQNILYFRTEEAKKLAMVLFNSATYFWWWRVFGDSFDVTFGDLAECPMPDSPASGYQAIADLLIAARAECTVFKGYRGVQVPNVNYNRRMDLIYKCDEWIWSHLPSRRHLDWEDILQYKSNSWFSVKVPKAQQWPPEFSHLARTDLSED